MDNHQIFILASFTKIFVCIVYALSNGLPTRNPGSLPQKEEESNKK